MRYWMLQENYPLATVPASVIAAFEQLGKLQRGRPEAAMIRVQHIMGGGVLSPTVEHVGDITHRMSHMVRYDTVLGYEKVLKTLRWLTNSYGFEREMQDNIRNNAEYRGVSPMQLKRQLDAALLGYAHAHEQLPVYNRAQWLARQAAIALGYQDFEQARTCLRTLLELCPTEKAFAEQAKRYQLDTEGDPEEYSP